ncbi:UCH domain containing protein [Hyaloscypha variabilis]
MGGAADLPQRSSSPLKRRASDLDGEVQSSQKDDVDMISVPPSDPAESADALTSATRSKRAQSVDMLRSENEDAAADVSTGESPDAAPAKTAETEIPSIDVQIKTVTTICEAAAQSQPKEGEKMYLVSKRWLKRVQIRSSEARKSSKIEPEGDIGPVDNSDIIQQIIKDFEGQEHVQLKPGTGLEDFTLFPEEAWNMVFDWYGLMPGSIPIIRSAHNTNPDKNGLPNVIFEFHPPIFTIHRLYGENNPINIPQKLKVMNPAAPILVFSRSTKYYDFLKRVKTVAGMPDMSKKVRLWRVPRIQPAAEPVAFVANTATPPSSRPSSPAPGVAAGPVQRQPQDSWTQLLLDVSEFVKLERNNGRELVDLPDQTSNPKYNGRSDLSIAGLGDDQTIVVDEQVTAGDNWVSNYTAKGSKSTSTALTRSGAGQSNSQSNSGRNSPAPSGPMTRGRTQKSGRPVGTVGLSNLGNTCYMNSALQCVRSVEELTKYFLTGAAKNEINHENPLGNNGDVAEAYERLLEEIYKDPPPTSVAPRFFKTTIGRYAPSFSGYGQQDSQEFLGFLLDGLQEDLSRVKKKPYIEKPDSTDEMVNNPEAIREMAAKVWDISKKRDDSVISDLFTGMYKSTLVCPEPDCAKVSITFDPFNNLTLQLPIENTWSHQITYYPLNSRQVILEVDMDKQGSILALKQFISKRVGVPTERLFAAEEFKSKFYKTYNDSAVASEEIQGNDSVAVYELECKPTNWPSPRKPKQKKKTMGFSYGGNNESDEDDVPNWDDPLADRMLVPVFHRQPAPDRNTRYNTRKPWLLFGSPHFIILTPEEARSEEAIKRKILEKVASFTTSDEFAEDEEDIDEANASAADSVDPDIVLTTGSDADSSGGSKVVANSIDGEDELVDVTMKDSNGAPESTENNAHTSKLSEPAKASKPPPFKQQRPKFVNPRSYLNPRLQNMFVIGYFAGSKEMIPSGWNVVDEDKNYPPISTRNPHVYQPIDEDSGNGFEDSRAGSESSEEGRYPSNGTSSAFSNTTRMADESDEDEDSLPARALPVRPAGLRSGVKVGQRRRKPNLKTYSKKGNQANRKHQVMDNLEKDAPDEGPLVRLGEGLVVDWNAQAYDALFNGDADDTMRGEASWSKVPVFHDPELQAKRTALKQRRKNGITLDDCLNEFGKEEVLSEMDTWYCPRCKEHRRATKKFELWKTPDILVMHLKRFSSSAFRRDKLDVFVDFPIEGLDLTSRVIETEEGKQEIYDLFAVDDHWGGLGGGHYTAFAKNFVDNEWYEYNDSSVTKQKDPTRVVSQSAYLLFYRRRSDVPLGGPRFQQIFHDYENPPDAPADDISESGEDQGLVAHTSLRGSSSALTGVGAAHHIQNGSDGEETMTVNPSALENLPAYEAHDSNRESDALNNPGAVMLWDSMGAHNDSLQQSIEHPDEGIEMSDNTYNSIGNVYGQSNWTFANLGLNGRGDHMVSGTGSDADEAASDIGQHNSSAGSNLIAERMHDFAEAQAEDEEGNFINQSPVPDLDEEGQAANIALTADLFEDMHRTGRVPIYQATPQFEVEDRLEVEEPEATEIHLDDNEDLKMD